MEIEEMTNEQYLDAKRNAITTVLYELLDEIEDEKAREVIKAKIKEVNQTPNPG